MTKQIFFTICIISVLLLTVGLPTNRAFAFIKGSSFDIVFANSDPRDIKFFFNDKYAAITSQTAGIQVWDLTAKKKVAELTLTIFRDKIQQLLSDDASSSDNKKPSQSPWQNANAYDKQEIRKILTKQIDHINNSEFFPIEELSISADAKVISLSLRNSTDTLILLWQPSSNIITPLLFDYISATVLSGKGAYLGLSMQRESAQKSFKVIDVNRRRIAASIDKTEGDTGFACFNHNQDKVYVVIQNNLFGYNLKNGKQIFKQRIAHIPDDPEVRDIPKRCFVSADDQVIYFCSRLYCSIGDLNSGKIIAIDDSTKSGGRFYLSYFTDHVFVENYLVGISSGMNKAYLINTDSFAKILKSDDIYNLDDHELIKIVPPSCKQFPEYSKQYKKYLTLKKRYNRLNRRLSAKDQAIMKMENDSQSNVLFYYKNRICINSIDKQARKIRHYFSHFGFYFNLKKDNNRTVINVDTYNFKNVLTAATSDNGVSDKSKKFAGNKQIQSQLQSSANKLSEKHGQKPIKPGVESKSNARQQLLPHIVPQNDNTTTYATPNIANPEQIINAKQIKQELDKFTAKFKQLARGKLKSLAKSRNCLKTCGRINTKICIKLIGAKPKTITKSSQDLFRRQKEYNLKQDLCQAFLEECSDECLEIRHKIYGKKYCKMLCRGEKYRTCTESAGPKSEISAAQEDNIHSALFQYKEYRTTQTKCLQQQEVCLQKCGPE